MQKVFELEDSFTLEKAILNYYRSSFSGVIVKKFIDEKNHGYRKIVLSNGKVEEVIYLDFEQDALFNSFQINDTLIKLANQSQILLKRNGSETTIKFNFENHVDREKYHKSLDTIILNYLNKSNEK